LSTARGILSIFWPDERGITLRAARVRLLDAFEICDRLFGAFFHVNLQLFNYAEGAMVVSHNTNFGFPTYYRMRLGETIVA
jgi:hypothetical protein